MKSLEERLREDAEAIHVEVGPELRARIAASVAGTEPHRPPRRHHHSGRFPRQLPRRALGGAIAAGVAVLALVIVRTDISPTDNSPPDLSATPPPVTVVSADAFGSLPVHRLRPEFALLELEQMATESLEEEQKRLEADLEKIRNDLRRAF